MIYFSEDADALSFNYYITYFLLLSYMFWGELSTVYFFARAAAALSSIRDGNNLKRERRMMRTVREAKRSGLSCPSGGTGRMHPMGDLCQAAAAGRNRIAGCQKKQERAILFDAEGSCHAGESVSCYMDQAIQKFISVEKPPPLLRKRRGDIYPQPVWREQAMGANNGGGFTGCLPTAPAGRPAAGGMCLSAAKSACPGRRWTVPAPVAETRQAVFPALRR